MSVHIGQITKKITEEKGMSKAELARRLHMTPQNVHMIFKKESLDTTMLMNISIILEHNFFSYLVATLPPSLQGFEQREIQALKEKISVLEKYIQLLEKQQFGA